MEKRESVSEPQKKAEPKTCERANKLGSNEDLGVNRGIWQKIRRWFIFKKPNSKEYLENIYAESGSPEVSEEFCSKEYWEKRYAEGGNSGSGSYNRLAEFKAEVMNEFVKENDVLSVIEWGCGDGNQLSLMRYQQYLGLDVSKTTVEACWKHFEGDASKEFCVIDDSLRIDRQFDLSISLDVIFHLVEDNVYERYMSNLFSCSKKYVCIYAKDEDLRPGPKHMRFWKFSDYISKAFPEWELFRHIPNRYPYDLNDIDNTSPSDFYFYQKRDVR